MQHIRNDDDVCIDGENRLDITIDRKSANQTPPPVISQDGNQQSEVAAPAVRHRFEDFSRSHCFFGVRRQSAAATALWMSAEFQPLVSRLLTAFWNHDDLK